MGEVWRGRCVAPSNLTGRRAASSPVNYYESAKAVETPPITALRPADNSLKPG